MADKYIEFRGVKKVYAAEVLCDDNESGVGHGYVTGTPFWIAGASNVTAETDSSMDTHFYDNKGVIVISAEGNTTVTIDASALTEEKYAKITGYHYNAITDAVVEGKRQDKYFALLYQYEDTDGEEHYKVFYKGKFAIPSATHATKNNSTDANGQTLTFTAVNTTHEFVNENNEGVKVMTVLEGKADMSNFFTTVLTPDTILPLATYTLTKTVGAGTTLVIQNVVKGTYLDDNDTIRIGDQLRITVTGGTVTVNGSGFISGDIHIVDGTTTVVSTAS